MKILEFVASLANSLAWPTVVVVLAIIFKTPVTALLDALHKRIPHLQRATGPGNLTIEFSQAAEEADAAAAKLPNPEVVVQGGDASTGPPRVEEFQLPYFQDEERRRDLGLQEPSAALLVTYGELQNQVRSFYAETGLADRRALPTGSTNRMAQELVSGGYLSENFLDVLRPVAAARAALAHGQVLAEQDRAEVRDLVERCADLATNVWLHRGTYKDKPRPYFSDPPE